MMDPDKTLHRSCELARVVLDAETDSLDVDAFVESSWELAEQLLELDAGLRAGGSLPVLWREARGPDAQSVGTVPPGAYLCQVAEVRVGTTTAGDERWSLRLVVAEGPHSGKQAAWDSLVFSTRGRARARLVLKAFGVRCNRENHVGPSVLEQRHALVEVRAAEYLSPLGEQVRRNEVPYDGYRMAATTDALHSIHRLMDGKTWSADTLQAIAQELTKVGFILREPEVDADGP